MGSLTSNEVCRISQHVIKEEGGKKERMDRTYVIVEKYQLSFRAFICAFHSASPRFFSKSFLFLFLFLSVEVDGFSQDVKILSTSPQEGL